MTSQGQSESSRGKNHSWFSQNNATYASDVATLDTYARIGAALNRALAGQERVVDIGSGGVFAYDTTPFKSIVAVDLFLDQIDPAGLGPNVELRKGDALDLPFATGSVEGAVVIVMLLHHLAGATVDATLANMDRAISEAHRVLAPGGRLVLGESCVPRWFRACQRVAYPLALRVLDKLVSHPVTFQDTAASQRRRVERAFGNATIEHVPKGRHVIQYGYTVPSWLTPVEVYLLTATKT